MRKKLLLGLAAMSISAISMAANVDLAAAPTNETTVFKVGQIGKIKVTGRLISEVPMLTYTVFATTDDGATDRQDILNLPDFLIKRPGGDKEGGFGAAVVPKVKVARVNASNDGIEALDTENVSFKVRLGEADFKSIGVNAVAGPLVYEQKLSAGKSYIVPPTAFLSKTELTAIAAENSLNSYDFSLNACGEIITPGGWAYCLDKMVECASPANGEFTMATSASMRPNSGVMTEAASRALETAFSGGKAFNNVFIEALVE